MPTYRYEVFAEHGDCGCQLERVCSIVEMTTFEAGPPLPRCAHGNFLGRNFNMRRSPVFHEGFYDNLGPEPIYVTSMDQLKRAARDTGNYSHYAQDMGGMFGAKEGRWV